MSGDCDCVHCVFGVCGCGVMLCGLSVGHGLLIGWVRLAHLEQVLHSFEGSVVSAAENEAHAYTTKPMKPMGVDK